MAFGIVNVVKDGNSKSKREREREYHKRERKKEKGRISIKLIDRIE